METGHAPDNPRGEAILAPGPYIKYIKGGAFDDAIYRISRL